jgi:AcrR family transcriptional regulator
MMARQTRSEATRRKIPNAAFDVFNEVGYSAAERCAIIERAEMTRGALYQHFYSMESLASAIIEEGSATVLTAFRSNCEASSPAMENMIHGTFVVADTLGSDEVARAAEQLTLALGGFNEAVPGVCTNWVEAMAAQGRRAIVEGDLREDPETLAESIVGAMFGAQLLSKAMPGGGHIERLRRMWELLPPAIVTDASLPYFSRVPCPRGVAAHPAGSVSGVTWRTEAKVRGSGFIRKGRVPIEEYEAQGAATIITA